MIIDDEREEQARDLRETSRHFDTCQCCGKVTSEIFEDLCVDCEKLLIRDAQGDRCPLCGKQWDGAS